MEIIHSIHWVHSFICEKQKDSWKAFELEAKLFLNESTFSYANYMLNANRIQWEKTVEDKEEKVRDSKVKEWDKIGTTSKTRVVS